MFDACPQNGLVIVRCPSRKVTVGGGQSMAWQKRMKTLTNKLAFVGADRLSDWGPQNASKR